MLEEMIEPSPSVHPSSSSVSPQPRSQFYSMSVSQKRMQQTLKRFLSQRDSLLTNADTHDCLSGAGRELPVLVVCWVRAEALR